MAAFRLGVCALSLLMAVGCSDSDKKRAPPGAGGNGGSSAGGSAGSPSGSGGSTTSSAGSAGESGNPSTGGTGAVGGSGGSGGVGGSTTSAAGGSAGAEALDTPTVVAVPEFDGMFRQGHLMLELTDGRVFVTGGLVAGGAPGNFGTDVTELYDLEARSIAQVDPLLQGRISPGGVLLPSGDVLVVGGFTGPAGSVVRGDSAEVFNPDSSGFRALSSTLSEPRMLPLVVWIESGSHAGSVLIFGGDPPPMSADLFDPTTEEFTPLVVSDAPEQDAEVYTYTYLDDGRVLVTGVDRGAGALENFVFDIETGTFTRTASFSEPRPRHTATRLLDGRVLVAGHEDNVSSAEIFDPLSETFAPVAGAMLTGRHFHAAALLGSGKVVFAGGNNALGGLDSVEFYDPESDGFVEALGQLSVERAVPKALSLSDGRVMILGGQQALTGGNSQTLSTTELIDE